ncbi:MAG: hypothetical protein ACRDT0_21405 [Pseudonocardiaceae bacterium]
MDATPDLAVAATKFAAGNVAAPDRTITQPVPVQPVAELSAVELSAPALSQDPAHEVQALAKGVALAEQQTEPQPPAADTTSCASSGFDGVASHVAEAGNLLEEMFGVDDVIGVASRPGNPDSDHPRGYALDFMVDRSTGDALADYAEENSEALGISYIIWQTEDHYDHVHISFNDEPGTGLLC